MNCWYNFPLQSVNMMRVLYTDLVIAKTDLEEAKSAYDLFKLLIGPGILKPTDISVLFETIEITGCRYLQEIIEQYETYPKEVEIKRFSAHRQHVVALGRGFSVKDVKKLSQLYRGNILFPNQWKLIEDLETDVLTEDKMSTFHQCLKETEVNKELQGMLVKLSSAISKTDENHIDMLRVLYTDLALTKTELEEAKSAYDLFKLLIGPGILKPTDISVLFETIEITGCRYLKKIIETYETYPREVKLTRFSEHRQNVVDLGRRFSVKDVQRLSQLYRGNRPFANQWKLMEDLETDVLTEDKMSTFLQCLKENEVNIGCGEASTSKRQMSDKGNGEASTSKRQMLFKGSGQESTSKRQMLDKGSGEASTSKRQMLDQDIIITDFLTERQKNLYQDVNLMTPTIWHEDHEVDIAEVFTELKLMQSIKKDRRSKSKSTSIKLKGRSTSLNEVLDVIKSAESCKVLISGKGGMGKTTLLRYIAYQWATDGVYNAFANKLLFLINIRDIKANESFVDIVKKKIDLKELILENKLPPNSVEDFLVIHADEIVILLDGYDELEKDAKDPIGLFRGKELRKSTVLMSSRPDNITKLIKFSDVHIMVKGFSPKNIKKYIRNHFRLIGKDAMGMSLITEFRRDDRNDSESSNGVFHDDDDYYYDSDEAGNDSDSSDDIVDFSSDSDNDFDSDDDDDYYYYDDDKEGGDNDSDNDDENSGSDDGVDFYNNFQNYKGLIFRIPRCRLHKNAFQLCSSPLLLLKICDIWRDKQCLPINLSDLFKELFCAILNQYQNKDGIKNPISEFDRIPEIYTEAIKILGECMYERLKDNKLSIDKYDLTKIAKNENLVCLALKLGFVYKDSPILPGYIREIYTTPHKLITEALAGFYLNKQIQNGNLNSNEYEVILCNNFLSMTRIFTIGFLGAEAYKLLRRWLINENVNSLNYFDWSYFSLTADSLKRLVESVGENETLNWKRIDMRRINLSSISGRTLAYLIKISTHLIHIDMSHCSLSGSIINEMMEECRRMNVVLKDGMLNLKGNDLSDIDGKSLAKFPSQPYGLFRWSDYSLTADNLEKLVVSVGANEKFNWGNIDMSKINLSSVSGRTLACLCKISTHLIHIDMSHCSLSGCIIGEMIKECHRMNVVLKCNMLNLNGNNLSDIDGESLAELLKVISRLQWSDYSLTANNLEKLLESMGENETLNWKWIDMGRINLSSINGRTLACLIKVSTNLISIDMSHCSLSGSIISGMMEEYHRMNVVLKDNILTLKGNDFSDIDGKSLAKLLKVINCYTFKWSDYSLTANNLEKLVESIGENETLNWKSIDMCRINLSSISGRTLAYLIKISTHLMYIGMSHCNLSGSIINEMMEECHRMNVVLKDTTLTLMGNDLSDIDGKSLAKFASQPYGFFRWSDYSLTADNLDKLVVSVGENEKLNWKRIDLSRINLSSVSGRTLACLCKISTNLTRIYMKRCSLSGCIISEMIKECCRMNVALKCNLLSLKGNNLSDIDGKSLVELHKVIYQPDTLPFQWSNYSLTANNLENLVESVGENETLKWKRIDMRGINLSSINGKTLACLIKVCTHLISIDLRHCSLSGSIINDMMKECRKRSVVLKNNMLCLKGNDLWGIDGKFSAELMSIML